MIHTNMEYNNNLYVCVVQTLCRGVTSWTACSAVSVTCGAGCQCSRRSSVSVVSRRSLDRSSTRSSTSTRSPEKRYVNPLNRDNFNIMTRKGCIHTSCQPCRVDPFPKAWGVGMITGLISIQLFSASQPKGSVILHSLSSMSGCQTKPSQTEIRKV